MQLKRARGVNSMIIMFGAVCVVIVLEGGLLIITNQRNNEMKEELLEYEGSK